jgi:hypothetical protein
MSLNVREQVMLRHRLIPHGGFQFRQYNPQLPQTIVQRTEMTGFENQFAHCATQWRITAGSGRFASAKAKAICRRPAGPIPERMERN